jgi:hypothetical protein
MVGCYCAACITDGLTCEDVSSLKCIGQKMVDIFETYKSRQ